MAQRRPAWDPRIGQLSGPGHGHHGHAIRAPLSRGHRWRGARRPELTLTLTRQGG